MSGGGKGRSRRRKKKPAAKARRRQPIGRLEADALLAHRELEFLRDAHRAGSGKVSKKGREKLAARAEKLKEARRIQQKYGGTPDQDPG